MPEHSDHTSAADFLESSELTARLLRRLTSSPGVIDIQDIFKTYARLTEWGSHARLLLDDLLARYSIDDGSALQNLPLVTEQPGMLNLNTYLTSSNSFSSTTNNSYSATTNEFVSQVLSSSSAASRLVPPALSSLRSQTGVSKHELSHEVKTTQLDSMSSTQTSGKFRVSRKPGRVTTEMNAAVAREVPKNPASEPAQPLTYRAGSTPRPGEEEKDAVAKAGDVKIGQAKNAASMMATPADLPLASRLHAPSPAQRELSDEDLNTSPVSKDRKSKGSRRPANQEQPALQSINSARVFSPLNKQTEITNLTLNTGREIPRRFPHSSRLALLQKQIVSAHPQRRQPDFFGSGNADEQTVDAQAGSLRTAGKDAGAPVRRDFVWRKNGIDRTAREMISAVSDHNLLQTTQRAASAVSTAQSSQSNQLVTSESVRRKDERPDSAEVTAEEILRSISNTLLVERDRRGY